MKIKINYISLSAALVIGIGCATVFGIGYFDNLKTKDAVTVIAEAGDDSVEGVYIEDMNSSAALTEYTPKFIQLAQYLSEKMTPEEMNEILIRYQYLSDVYGASPEQMDYIADLILDGSEPADIIDIAFFWTDTCEDVTIVKDIYELRTVYSGTDFWIENAYNYVTDYVHGELEADDVRRYFDAGLTAEQIQSANILSRSGDYTITEILDSLLSGKSMVQVFNSVYSTRMSEPVNLFGLNDKAVQNTCELINAKELAGLKKITVEEAANEIISSDEPQGEISAYKDAKYAELTEGLIRTGIVPGTIDEDLGVRFGE